MKHCPLHDDAVSPSLVQVYTSIPSLCALIGAEAMPAMPGS